MSFMENRLAQVTRFFRHDFFSPRRAERWTPLLVFLLTAGGALLAWLEATKRLADPIFVLVVGFLVSLAVTAHVGFLLLATRRARLVASSTTAELHASEESFRELSEITSSPGLRFEEKINALFVMVLQRLNLEEALLCYVKGDWCEVGLVRGLTQSGRLRKGALLPLTGILRQIVLNAPDLDGTHGKALVTGDLSGDQAEGLPPEEWAVGLPVLVSERVHACLVFFGDPTARFASGAGKRLLPREQALIKILGHWFAGEFERQLSLEDRNRIFALSSDLLAILEFGGGFKDLNGAWETALGFSHHALAELQFLELVHSDDRSRVRSHMAQLLAGKRIQGTECRLVCKDGKALWFAWSAVPYLQESHIYLVAHDVNENKLAAEALKAARDAALQANRSKSEFLASMSQDIRTPLAAISDMADMLFETQLNRDQENYLGILRRSGNHLLTLVDEIIDLARIESGFAQIDKGPVSLFDLVRDLGDAHGASARKKGLHFSAEVDVGVPSKVIGDDMRLRQALGILLAQIFESADHGHLRLSIRLSQDDDMKSEGSGMPLERLPHMISLTFKLHASGLEMPEERLESLFDFFSDSSFATSSSAASSSVGSSAPKHSPPRLGLAIGKRLIEMMGGHLWVASQPGQGTTFFFSLDFAEANTVELLRRSSPRSSAVLASKASYDHPPRASISPQHQNSQGASSFPLSMSQAPVGLPATERVAGQGGGAVVSDSSALLHRRTVCVLLVDDSEDNQILVQAFLKSPRYQVDVAENGKEGVRKFVDGRYDIVLMDIQMPVMDGYRAIQAIRMWESEKGFPPTPIIAVSANAQREDEVRSLQAGADAHLAKPIDFRRLRDEISRFLKARFSHEDSPLKVAMQNSGLEPRQVHAKNSDEHAFLPAHEEASDKVISLEVAFRKMIPVFLANRAKDINKVRTALVNGDFEAIRLIGHSMKGSGRSYGFAPISDLGLRLESAARDKSIDGVKTEIAALARWLESMKTEIPTG